MEKLGFAPNRVNNGVVFSRRAGDFSFYPA